ncbi:MULTISPECIES: hypothetical protein [Serratia]|uniref:hypothetical protein n=1 Tax=Serratia marcescens TaxID=615 RepID=UPI002E32C2C6|nr:hypothetical protein [Serratia marcescens]
MHVYITRGGLDVKHAVWRPLFFKKWQVSTPPNCSLTGCNGWRKNDGFRAWLWISAPEKWVLA